MFDPQPNKATRNWTAGFGPCFFIYLSSILGLPYFGLQPNWGQSFQPFPLRGEKTLGLGSRDPTTEQLLELGETNRDLL